ncbi:tetratricopeptide repeat protein [Pyxidicoccus trucidator]|uniref:tetratricopeptide repeat protein n=1 Tax=Pyxidicoccus trucidator TaxID=2709662 RepID=UPI001F078EA0|nr:tetratricopeptide repeat protein [Pyxidicoccus trucidator]
MDVASPALMGLKSNRLGVLGEQGERLLELEHVRRVLAHRERVYGAAHPDVALDVHEVGRLLRLLGRPDEARGFHARGVSFQRPLVDKGEMDGAGLRALADALLFLGQVDEARRHVEQALASMERDLGPSSSERIEAPLLLGDVQLARGQPAEALVPLRTALEALTALSRVAVDFMQRCRPACPLTGALHQKSTAPMFQALTALRGRRKDSVRRCRQLMCLHSNYTTPLLAPILPALIFRPSRELRVQQD